MGQQIADDAPPVTRGGGGGSKRIGMKKAVVGSLVAIASLGFAPIGAAQHADAADFGARPLLSPESMWTGLYGGINTGGLWAAGDAAWTPLPSAALFGANGASGNLGTGGVVAGFQAGINVQPAPAWVAGIEADFTGAHASSNKLSTWTTFGTNAPIAGSFTQEIRTLEWLSTARGRVGYLLTPATLIYFTGGAAWAGASYAGGNSAPGGYASAVSFFQAQPGYVLGGGVEFATWDRWLLRGEYLFHRFNDVSAVGTAPHFPNIPSGYSWTGFDVQEIRAAVSYKF
jgi:outer membrane immunogenic protein